MDQIDPAALFCVHWIGNRWMQRWIPVKLLWCVDRVNSLYAIEKYNSSSICH